ncbi:contact-dependent growth inhibition system immunity protein [uncultured Streptomyces sp.]|uniref:contact-dependent growth inhibition system immunity protein n=1 Tax=uncultured Streptomyces sp. TaxID=174707 RepID=UPI00261582BB|nr:contact-dependent growth inhibition system immunity protein [uncultured Streptomyces sp.]
MDRLLHPDRSLDELDTPRWDPPGDGATTLVRRVHALRQVPLRELGPGDLRMLVSQAVALPFVLPLAVRLLVEDPLLDATFYAGDLLLATTRLPASAWEAVPELAAGLREAIARLPDQRVADAGLPRGSRETLDGFLAAGASA